MIDVMQAQPRLRTFRRAEYDALTERGFFADERIELLDGVIVEMSPQGAPHARVIQKLTMLLAPALQGRADLRVQSPLAVSDDSEPEPDLAVVEPDTGDVEHPHTAHLVIEVSGDSLRTDRLIKTRLYAAAGVPEYWIVNLTARVVEVHTEPGADGYARKYTVQPADTITLRAFPQLTVRVAEFLPAA